MANKLNSSYYEEKSEKWYITEMHNYRYIIDHLQEEIENLIEQILPNHRQRRGIINGLGSIIKDLQQGQKNNAKVLKKQISLAKNAIVSFNNIMILESLIDIKAYQQHSTITFLLEVPLVSKETYDLYHLYSHQQHSTITFLLEVPLVSKETYDLYHLYSLPIPINNAMKFIIPTAHYVLYNEQYYGNLNDNCKEILPA
ncbi:Baculovirus F protein [Popillia japonica]|uniref:Baculovirus F protein n=1 Tax=Popillia japonica TaxID=7064 RepID=A0AAW1KQU5_POPJA